MKYRNKYVISAFFLSFLPVSVSVHASMEVKGFKLSEGTVIKEIYGSCHRLEEPLTLKIVAGTTFVALGKGWQAEIKYRFREGKKYYTEFISDSGSLTNSRGEGIISGTNFQQASGPDGNGYYTDMLYPSANSDGLYTYHITLPTRNLDYLSIRFSSVSNGRGNTIIWSNREGNVLSGSWLSQPVQTTSSGFLEDPVSGSSQNLGTLSFNLVNLDYLLVDFRQRNISKPTPGWELTANKLRFRDGNGYTAEQFEAACK